MSTSTKAGIERRGLLAAGGSMALMGLLGDKAAAAAAGGGWESLFNGKDLSGWYTFLNRSGKNSDPERLIRVENRMIHVLGAEPTEASPEAGYFATERDFENYHLRVELKWGERRYPPRALWKRDNGILYHIVGEDRFWPTCVEFQAQEGDFGDCFGVAGARGRNAVRFTPGYVEGGGPPGLPHWPSRPAGAAAPAKTSSQRKVTDFEIRDGWNVLELISLGGKSAHIVNGRLVASVFDLEVLDAPDSGRYVPLTRGRIGLQCEWAETWIRKVEIRRLPPSAA